MPNHYPFTAVVGQDEYKLALKLAAICPQIGGVLVSGPRGCAKSTLARGFSNILPDNTSLFVNLPLGTTEEMLIGSLNLQKVMQDQNISFRPGLLHKAHGGVLYVDEVNLLSDHLVDVLLDVASSGVNTIERDGISESHPSEFILLGTMNPDEGDLRPQLLDRFGLFVELKSHFTSKERVSIVSLRDEFDRNPAVFIEQYLSSEQEQMQQIVKAKALLPEVTCSMSLRELIAQKCSDAQVEGLRADIVWFKSACAHAASHQRQQVTEEDINAVEALVLAHRRKNTPSNPPSRSSESNFSKPPPKDNEQADNNNAAQGEWGKMDAVHQPIDHTLKTALEAFDTLPDSHSKTISQRSLLGSTLRNTTSHCLSSYGHASSTLSSPSINWVKTIIKNLGLSAIESVIYKPYKTSQSVVNLVLLDTSASVLHGQAFSKAKAIMVSLSERAYLNREFLSLLGFGNQSVDLLLPLMKSPKDISSYIDNIRAGGGTPLRDALIEASDYQNKITQQLPQSSFRNTIITDGKTKQCFDGLNLLGKTTVIDVEQSQVRRGRSKALADILSADYFHLDVISTS
jgi:magnesium chelatase subunit D